MFIDARTLPSQTTIDTDVCIIGAGAAGITIARELAGQPFRVCLLESGGLEFEADTQSLYAGENTGVPYYPLDVTRLRFFGGSTNHWAGFCRPLDTVDFEPRDGVPDSGWPFARAQLDDYYARAQRVCHLGPNTYDPGAWETAGAVRLPFLPGRVETTIFQFSRPKRFGKIYRDEIARASNITTYLYANVLELETGSPPTSVTRLRVATLTGTEFSIVPSLVILATGGIENARLLLLSNRVQANGLGNQHDLVGRFFMEHLGVAKGVVVPSDPYLSTELYLAHDHDGHRKALVGALTLTDATLRRERLLNAVVTMRPTWPASVQSILRLGRALRHGEAGSLATHLRSVLADYSNVAQVTYGAVRKGRFPMAVLQLEGESEQAPNPESRITLASERDRLGANRVQLRWQLSGLDKVSLRRTQEIIGEELGRAGLGRLRTGMDDGSEWSPPPNGAHHHMGTTRMHVDPKRGVVDADCRVHGMSNLFIAGSSVFPTAGSSNPTLTIVALAVRLADHVTQRMRA